VVAPETVVKEKVVFRPIRHKLPDERKSLTHKFSIGGHEGYITVGMYEDGKSRRGVHFDGEGRVDD
jgi:ribonucleoside-diphosphate reductase alpha chain